MSISFSSLKYPEGSQEWGFHSYRYDLQTNERIIWPQVPQNQFPINIGYFGKLIFEEPLPPSNTPVYVIPYVNGLVSNNFSDSPSQPKILAGGYLKIPIGNGLNHDVTLNPDF